MPVPAPGTTAPAKETTAGTSLPRKGSRLRPALAGGLLGLLLALLVGLGARDLQEGLLALLPHREPAGPVLGGAEAQQAARQHRQGIRRLEARLNARIPRQPYLVVSTTENRFWLRQGTGLLREGLCSTGSYVRLEGATDQTWTFFTPRGAFKILGKMENPVWRKPDWAFVEEGRPVPPPGAPERYERGVLGDYALALGQGYLIHGTLYQRLLGLPVTHGCIRLGDDDLRAVYLALRLGAPVFIY
ncbi:L,D-transpeptidase [Rhodocaloribacter litoris]|uniref:L,D-transpeptidase n=1 Tax=Rhodocaloribacter litoris TaxID=2558931 RepID=UPI0014220089|nr:L,D-transpeptidase [Rhodocaloribacter litoris]QXD15279.1 L,D-transpeptidase [Rhodocaloribacter litoris]